MAQLNEAVGETLRVLLFADAVHGVVIDVVESLRVGPFLAVGYGPIIREQARIGEAPVPTVIANVLALDVIALADMLQVARDVTAVENVTIAFAQELQRVIALADRLRIAHAAVPNVAYRLTVQQVVRLTDQLLRFLGADVADGMQLDSAALGRALAHAGVAETLGIDAALAPQLLVKATIVDGVEIDPADALQLLFNPTLMDGVEFTAGYLAPDGNFTTWAMNTRSGAVTEYSNFVFNSFARVGNRYIAASDQGLHELLGDDDDGEAIIARLQSGYMQFGGTRLSRLKEAYIAARNEGEMLLKIVEAGGKTYVYRTATRDMRSTKVHMGKGQRARYFAFELVTTGQDFDLDTIEFVPIVVQRRV